MKVYILYGEEEGWYSYKEVYAVTLDSTLKDNIISKYEHDFPKLRFEWGEEEAIMENEK